MYSAAAIEIFGQVKAAFDPENLLNPECWSIPAGERRSARVALVGRVDDFTSAVHRCSGVGKCLANTTAGLGVMCPSYQATREEKDSTRGRARVQEMINGEVVHGWNRLQCTKHWIFACPVRDAHAIARPGSIWPRTSRRCSITPIAARSGRAATTRSAGCRVGAG